MSAMEHLRRLLEYESWATGTLFDALRAVGRELPAGVERTMAHVVAANYLWFSRLEGEKGTVPVWPEWRLAESHEEWGVLPAVWSNYALMLDEERLARSVAYRNSRGEDFVSTVEEILTHVAMHGMHHRGQVISALRAAGIEPPVLDFIHAARQGFI